MRRCRSYFLILLALWLPLQAAAAWVMPFCAHAAAARGETQVMPAPCHHEQPEVPTLPAADPDCDNCKMCQLASAGYLLALVEAVPFTLAGDVMVARPVSSLSSHIGDPPRHPPRSRS